jgi:hypothetical protein
MRWLRVVACLAEVTQQIHSFRASGVKSFQAACVVASKPRAFRKSAGVLCTGPALLSVFVMVFSLPAEVLYTIFFLACWHGATDF